jgi:hypothetical protein
MLWDKSVAIVAYSFGGLIFKSLVVEAHKHVYQRPMNDFDFKVQKYCELFLNNLKGVVFYSVPHAGWYPKSIKIFQMAMSKNHQRYNLIMYFEKYEIFQPKDGTTFNVTKAFLCLSFLFFLSSFLNLGNPKTLNPESGYTKMGFSKSGFRKLGSSNLPFSNHVCEIRLCENQVFPSPVFQTWFLNPPLQNRFY